MGSNWDSYLNGQTHPRATSRIYRWSNFTQHFKSSSEPPPCQEVAVNITAGQESRWVARSPRSSALSIIGSAVEREHVHTRAKRSKPIHAVSPSAGTLPITKYISAAGRCLQALVMSLILI
jgi:hypothetical protein